KRQDADAAEKKAEVALADAQAKPDDKVKQDDFAKKEADARKLDRAATQAEEDAARVRDRLVGDLQRIVNDARTREDKALGIRKFKNGEIDAAKANVDIAIRDNRPEEELNAREKKVNDLMGDMAHPEKDADEGKQTYAAFNEIYQSISKVRKDLERTAKQINADVDAAQKRFDDSRSELERIRKQERDREEP